MLNFLLRRRSKAALVLLVLGCTASRIYFVVFGRLFHPNDQATVACAIVYAVIAAALVITVIVVAKPSDFNLIRSITVVSILGAGFGLLILSDVVLHGSYGYDHGWGETDASNFIGALVGIGLAIFLLFFFRLPTAEFSSKSMPTTDPKN